jgi:hypothetical protein
VVIAAVVVLSVGVPVPFTSALVVVMGELSEDPQPISVQSEVIISNIAISFFIVTSVDGK